MGRAIELVSGTVPFSNTVLTAVTMAAGDSLVVRNAPVDSRVLLISAWADVQVANAIVQIRSPKLHDNVRGLRWLVPVANVRPLLPIGVGQRLYPQDTLIAEIQVADAAGDQENLGMLIYYENLPGTDARLATWEDVQRRMTGQILTVAQTLALVAGANWGGQEAINAEVDLMKANTDYALLGYTVGTQCESVAWRGADTGNLRVGGPGQAGDDELTQDWFKRLSQASGLPCIPIFNSANRAGILLDGVQDENGADVELTSIFLELGAAAPGR